MNTATIIGRAGQDAEIRYFESGKVKTTFSLAVGRWDSKTKEELIMDYAIVDEKTQTQLNSQLEKENIYTKIDVPTDNVSSPENLPVLQNSFWDTLKKFLNILKDAFIKFFGDGE